MDRIQLDYVVAPAGVADYVTIFYHFRADVPVFEDTERADHAQLRLRLSPGGATYRFADGTAKDASDLHIVGPTSGAFNVHAKGPVHVFGAGITPAGWAAMIGLDASTMLNRVIDATDLFGDRIEQAAAAIKAAEGCPNAMSRIGEALVLDLVRGGSGDAVEFMRRVDNWLAASASPDVEHLVQATGLSRRQVERRCNALYGAPPKLLARKYRALKAAVALVSGGAEIGDVLDCGFYDQSHLIREIKQFTGLTPGQMRAEPNLLTRMTIDQRSALDGQVSPMVSRT